jgi:protein TonB
VLPPKLLAAPDPVYPPLAKQARIQGDVLIDAVIDANGQVAEMQVVSGHPMLITAALDALRRWRYQPTILNDEPTSVQLVVTVRFRLN